VARYLAGERNLPPYTYVPSILVTKDNAGDVQKSLGQGAQNGQIASK
ncbi:MAG TPA: sugar ABC transporter substrate-binding protein, partial [Paraburkholderia sp.]|nr:sugar ABC transporter substrate-binding protein [Paraburkholderia sp.]